MRVLFAMLLSVALAPHEAAACMHAPGGAAVKEHRQSALIVHGDGVEDLVLRVEYGVDPGTAKLGWIIPVPSVPTAYAALSRELFEQVDRWVGLEYRPDIEAVALGLGGLEASEPHSVGPYDIQPLRAAGEAGAAAVNAWLIDHGFAAIDSAALRYYADRDWTFLAVSIAAGGSGALPSREALPPLQITFRTERPVFPLKLSTHMGEFAAELYVFSRRPYSNDALAGALDRGFGVVTGRRYLRPMDESGGRWVTRLPRNRFSARRAPRALRPLLRRLGNGTLCLTVLRSGWVNGASSSVERRPARWSEDLSIGPPMRLDAARLAPPPR